MMRVHVVARSDETAQEFVSRHQPFADHISVHTGVSSYFALLNEVIADSSDAACVVHDDVYLPAQFMDRLSDLRSTLEREWPNWGVCGNAGVVPFQFGGTGTHVVRYLFDPHGGPNLQGAILPAIGVDGNVLFINCSALKAANVKLPAFEGFHLYDVTLCLETIRAGRGVLVAPHLACYHDSPGSHGGFDAAARSLAYQNYLARAVRNRTINTINGSVSATTVALSDRGAIDTEMDSLRCAARGRLGKHVAIVVRSQFVRPSTLRRTLESILAFCIAARPGGAVFMPYVVTDKMERCPDFVERYAEIKAASFPGFSDTRNKLVEYAIQSIEADYFWFVDDDDWLFPNEAERLGLIIGCAPNSSIFFVNSQYFHEEAGNGESAIGRGYSVRTGRYFSSREWLKSLSGHNHIPFCGFICNRQTLLAAPQTVYDRVSYFEDFALQLFAIQSVGIYPILMDKLVAGISVRKTGNTITETNRMKWNASCAEMASAFCQWTAFPAMLSMPQEIRVGHASQMPGLGWGAMTVAKDLLSSRSWRYTKPLRWIACVVSGRKWMEPGAPVSEAEALIMITRIVGSTSWAASWPLRFFGRLSRVWRAAGPQLKNPGQ
jgi:hypothetical protein